MARARLCDIAWSERFGRLRAGIVAERLSLQVGVRS